MELETLVQRLSLDGTQFFAALDQAEREPRQTGAVSEQTSRLSWLALPESSSTVHRSSLLH